MLDVPSNRPVHAVITTDQDVEVRKRIVGLEQDDIVRIVSLKDIIEARADAYVDDFFNHVRKFTPDRALFARSDLLLRAKQLKRAHLLAIVRGKYDREYVQERIELATFYSTQGMGVRAFIGGFQRLMEQIGLDILAKSDDPADAFRKFQSLTKVGSFDVSITSDAMIADRERTIGVQQSAIRELSTPVLQVRDRLLILPIIGLLDSNRAKQLTTDLLSAIRATRCRMVVMDITGVAAVDSKVANHLIQTVAAVRLMGSAVIITGLSAEVAQALVMLGIDLRTIDTTSDLQSGLEQAERSLGYRVVRAEEAAV
jgi:rsbT co-antagonist protein RsbR